MTIEDVSYNIGMSWNTIKNIEKKHLQTHYSNPDLSNLQRIGIDEFSVAKSHTYMTVVMDLDQSKVIYVGEGRSSESLDKFWTKLRSKNIKPKAIAMDMWPAYIKSVLDNAPEADIIFDRFHIVKMLNKAIDELRRDIYRDETNLNKRTLMKGTRWLILLNPEKLTDKTKSKLNAALAVNRPLAAAYYLKEELRLLWSQKNLLEALSFLEQWVKKAVESGIKKLIAFANTLMAHRTGIISWYKHRISTGPLEGFNNKIKVLKRKAYGYRDFEFFILKIYALHSTRYALL